MQCRKSLSGQPSALSDSVPAIVADVDFPAFDLDRKGRRGFVSRGRKGFACSDTKARTVPRADDLIALDGAAAGEYGTVVGADVLDRVEVAVDVEHRRECAVEIDGLIVAALDACGLGDENPVRHGKTVTGNR